MSGETLRTQATASHNQAVAVPDEFEESRITGTVVICTRHRPDTLRKCLEAVAQQQLPPEEVIVVDNSAGDRATECAARDYGARYLVEPNLGLSRARNLGLAVSKSAIVAFLDDDSVPEPQWLGSLLEPFHNARVASVTGKTISSDAGSPGPCEEDPVWFISNEDPKWFERAAFGALGIGANMAFRKDACAGSSFFDTRLGRGGAIGGGEESHAFLTLLCRGYSAAHTSKAVVSHPSKPMQVEQEASTAVAYWLLLLREFPGHRIELLHFLFRRLRHKPLDWRRDSPAFGPLVTSSWETRLKAVLAALRLLSRSQAAATRADAPSPGYSSAPAVVCTQELEPHK
ncbi:MAG: glycosyltransferase family 2 protein [Terracidiphilus sp.]